MPPMTIFRLQFLFLALSILLIVNCTLHRKEYHLTLLLNKGCTITSDTKVLWEGLDIGRVSSSKIIDSNTVELNLLIQRDIKIPASNVVQCWDNLLGSTYIAITAGENVDASKYLHPLDTLRGRYVSQAEINSNLKKKILDKAKDVKKTTDSILNTNDK